MRGSFTFIYLFLFSTIPGIIPAKGAPREKIYEQTYIISSQPYYLSGQDLPYVAYLFNAESGEADVESKILVTEFTDHAGRIVFSHRHKMTACSSPGVFQIPDTLGTGHYWLRSYTRYQIGFTENTIHYLPVFIINSSDLSENGMLEEKLHYPSFSSTKNKIIVTDTAGLNNQFKGDVRTIVNNGTYLVSIRDSIHLHITITDEAGKPVRAHFTVRLRDREQFGELISQQSNFPGNLYRQGPVPEYRLEDETQTITITDNPGRIGSTGKSPVYPPRQDLKLRGTNIDPESGGGLPFRGIALTQTGEKPGFRLMFTDRDGNFEFGPLDFQNSDNRLVLNAGNNNGIVIEKDTVRPSFAPPRISGDLVKFAPFRNYIRQRKLELQYRKFYRKNENLRTGTGTDRPIDRLRIYDKPDLHYRMDDYIELKNMREVIVELLPNVKIYRNNDITRIKIYHHNNTDIIPDPLFLVDGLIVKDNDFILNMDNRNISVIEVLYDKETLAPFGPLGIGGVVAIYTKEPVPSPAGFIVDMPGYHVPAYTIIGHQPAGEQSDHIPDFNPLLYWNPVGETGTNGTADYRFAANDLAADFEMILEGITATGEPFCIRSILKIGKPASP